MNTFTNVLNASNKHLLSICSMPDAALSTVATMVKEADPVLRAPWGMDGIAGVEGRGSPVYGLS